MSDQFTPATSFLVVACVGRSRYFDLDAVREPLKHPNHSQLGKDPRGTKGKESKRTGWVENRITIRTEHPAGAPPLDWWVIPDTAEPTPPGDTMGTARYLIGDVFERMAELPDGSVDLVLTSPPFLALRSYLPADHPDKAKEIGSEPTPAVFLDTLLALTAEWRRVLAPHGSICVELGDTYSGSGGGGGDYLEGGMREGQPGFGGTAERQREGNAAHWRQKNQQPDAWPLAKSLCGIPHLYHLSLAYGRNLLTGEASPAGQWRVRNVVAWCRPNPPVGALGDKFRPATSYLTVACPGRSRYFDLDAVREPLKHDYQPYIRGATSKAASRAGKVGEGPRMDRAEYNPAGAPPLDWWEIPTQPYAGSHYATWPEALCVRPIKAMCPSRVCRVCGKPSERIVSEPEYVYDRVPDRPLARDGDRLGRGFSTAAAAESRSSQGTGERGHVVRSTETLGWSDCGHNDYRRGVVLDPFAGSGTTLAVAVGHGRDALGIDLDYRNADLARERCGMFLTVEEPSPYLSERPIVDVPPSEEIA